MPKGPFGVITIPRDNAPFPCYTIVMFIVAGLGNPGVAYEKSRHNAGYMALDRVAEKLSIRVTKRGFSGVYGEGVRNGERILLIKPTTYMNLSGDCLQSVSHFYKVPSERVLVLFDDIELPVGTLRIRDHGSAGTHNGMRSVVACLGSENIPRIRIGVSDERKGDLKDYVLGKPGQEELSKLNDVYNDAADAVAMILDGRMGDAQTKYNKRHIGGGPKPDGKAGEA